MPSDIVQVCVFTAPLFSAFCALTTYFLAKEVRSQGAGLFAALFAASVPSYISRSVAGSYDNEGVAIFALVLVFFLYVKVWPDFTGHSPSGTCTSGMYKLHLPASTDGNPRPLYVAYHAELHQAALQDSQEACSQSLYCISRM